MSAPLIPERLKKSREACGINKTEAAKIIGLTQSGYVRYENGERKPTIQVIEAMALKKERILYYLRYQKNLTILVSHSRQDCLSIIISWLMVSSLFAHKKYPSTKSEG